MKYFLTPLKKTVLSMTALILVLGGSACGPAPAAAPVIQTVVSPKVVTVPVTQDVTQVVTRVVDVPVTVTPEPTQPPTPTPDPNATPAPASLPQASLPAHTDCLYGPADWYEYKSSFTAGQQLDVVGKSEDGNWLNVEETGGWNACWIEADLAQLLNTQVESLPVVQPVMPLELFGLSSPYASAKRDGDEVTLSWKAVRMSADEVRGYLIRAKLCKDGQIIPQDIFIPMTFETNVGTLTYTVIDEGGCSDPSEIHMISYTRRGFAYYYQLNKIGWERVILPPRP
jgi:hypothetical protein